MKIESERYLFMVSGLSVNFSCFPEIVGYIRMSSGCSSPVLYPFVDKYDEKMFIFFFFNPKGSLLLPLHRSFFFLIYINVQVCNKLKRTNNE